MTFHHILPLVALAAFTLVLNLPFGFLRRRTDRYSWRWFLCIHLSIPIIFFLRKILLLTPASIPWLVAAAILGQVLGGKQQKTKTK